jgi:hypothetical protein
MVNMKRWAFLEEPLVQALAKIGDRLQRTDSMAAWNYVVTGYREERNAKTKRTTRVKMAEPLVPCLDPKDAREQWDLFLQEAQEKKKDRALALASLPALADRLDRNDLQAVWDQLVRAVLDYKVKTRLLTKIAIRMAPSDAPAAARVALNTMADNTGSILTLVMGLGAMGNKLDPVDARAAGNMLLRNFGNYPPIPAGAAVLAIKDWLDPADLRSAAKHLVGDIARDDSHPQTLARKLVKLFKPLDALEGQMDGPDRRLVGKRLVEVMDDVYPATRNEIVEFLAKHPNWLDPSDVNAAVAQLAQAASETKRDSLADLKILVDALPDDNVTAILAKLIGAPVGKRPASMCRAVPAFVREGKPQTVKLVVEDVLKWPTCQSETRINILEELALLEGNDPAMFSRTIDGEKFELDRWKFASWSKPRFDISTMPNVRRQDIH